MILHADFLNGPFGDPALYVRETNRKQSILFDCGDLTRFSTKWLLKVSHIFLSHCHMDHFFGFDLYLRVHIGSEKKTTIVGPPETGRHVAGKLAGYTWNLIHDQDLEFAVIDLDPERGQRHFCRLRAKDGFARREEFSERWDPAAPVLETETFQVRAALLDHRTPSMAYAIEEKLAFAVSDRVLDEMDLVPGPWINALKKWFLFDRKGSPVFHARSKSGEERKVEARALVDGLLTPIPRHKIAYATDGAAHEQNRKTLLQLVRGADVFFSETCFLQEDEQAARDTKHFTAAFVGSLAREAGVEKLAPFHFSKRYLGKPERVLEEVGANFGGPLVRLEAAPPYPRL